MTKAERFVPLFIVHRPFSGGKTERVCLLASKEGLGFWW